MAVIGEDEMANGMAVLRDMQLSEEKTVPITELNSCIKAGVTMSEVLQGWKRTDYCTNFSTDDVGKVTLMGWVQTRRDFGALIFVDLRDRTGIMQLVFDESVLEGTFHVSALYATNT